MNKITITLNDANKIDELLNLVAALPYVESARFEDAGTNQRYEQMATELNSDADHARSPFYRDPRTQIMDKEIAAFEAMKTDLVAQYIEQYVAIFQGAVVDHDPDKVLLLNRIAQTHPHEVVLVRQVRHAPRPPFRLRSPRLNRDRTG